MRRVLKAGSLEEAREMCHQQVCANRMFSVCPCVTAHVHGAVVRLSASLLACTVLQRSVFALLCTILGVA